MSAFKTDEELLDDAGAETRAGGADVMPTLNSEEEDRVEEALGAAEAAAKTAAAPTPTTTAAAPAVAATPAVQAVEAAPAVAAVPAADKVGGSTAAALRASRHAERVAKARADDLARENAELKAKLPTQQATAPLDASTLEDLENYAKPAAERLRQLEAENAAFKAAAPAAAAPAAPEWEPDIQKPAVQEVVDANPDLLEWQSKAENAALWDAAVAQSNALDGFPGWRAKPLADRFAEVVRRVKADAALATSPAPSASLADAQRVIDAAKPVERPFAVGDLRGGEPPSNAPVLNYSKMSDEDIIASM